MSVESDREGSKAERARKLEWMNQKHVLQGVYVSEGVFVVNQHYKNKYKCNKPTNK